MTTFDRVLGPMLFTLFGACLGFMFGRLKEWLDDKSARRAFLRTIRIELQTLQEHLQGTLKDATESRASVKRGEKKALHLATTFLTTVYSSQLQKLRDLDNRVIIEIVRFYGDLSNLERVKSQLFSASTMLTTLGDSERDREIAIALHYQSTLDEVIKRIEKLLPQLAQLLAKLPQ